MEYVDLRTKDFLEKHNIPEEVRQELFTFKFEVLNNTSKKDLQAIAGKGAGYNIYALLHGEGGTQPVASRWTTYFDNVRYVFSTIITLISIGLICYSIGKGYAALPGHPVMHYILLVFVIVLLAYLEGLQIAILALERTHPNTFKHKHRAFVAHSLAMKYDGHNVQRFLVGRQFFVVFVVFLCAQLTTYADLDLSFMPPWLFTMLIQTGLPGALIVLAFGQLMPQLVATTNPITFMDLPGTWSVLQLCLCFESVGVTHFSWVLSGFVRFVFTMGAKEDIEAPIKGVEMSVCGSRSSKRLYESVKIENDDKLNELYRDAAADCKVSEGSEMEVKHNKQVMGWLDDRQIPLTQGRLPTPDSIVSYLTKNNKVVPRYLLPSGHILHVPPFLVARELLRREALRNKLVSTGEHEMKTFNTDQFSA